jgi:hypothetical protein
MWSAMHGHQSNKKKSLMLGRISAMNWNKYQNNHRYSRRTGMSNSRPAYLRGGPADIMTSWLIVGSNRKCTEDRETTFKTIRNARRPKIKRKTTKWANQCGEKNSRNSYGIKGNKKEIFDNR